MTATMLDIALDLARQGVAVFPCNPADKTPLIPRDKDANGNPIPKTGGVRKATTDEAIIAQWWHKWPKAMVGAAMGEVSGLVALDPDRPKAPGDPDGVENWQKLTASHPPIDTRVHGSPHGGRHYLFAYDRDRPLSNGDKHVRALGINVRGEWGYIIWAGSVMADGKRYTVIHDLPLEALPPVPSWLYDTLRPAKRVSERAVENARARKPKTNGAGPGADPQRHYAEAALEDEVHELRTARPGARHSALNEAGFYLGQLVAAGVLERGEVEKELKSACEENRMIAEGRTAEVERTIAEAIDAGMAKPRDLSKVRLKAKPKTEMRINGGPPPTSPVTGTNAKEHNPPPDVRPQVFIGGGRYEAVAVETEAAIVAAEADIYIHNERLVRPARTEAVDADGKEITAPALDPLTVELMRQAMDRAARFYKLTANDDFVLKQPPEDIARLMLQRKAEWPYRQVSGILSAPTIRRDGTVLATPGYDPASRLFLFHPPPVAIHSTPTLVTATKARDYLIRNVLAGFHFVDDLDRACALSLLLSAVARGGIGHTPLHAVTAPAAGSGKSLIVDCASALVQGTRCPVIGRAHNAEELEKRIDAELIIGRAMFSLDNVNGELGGDRLCQAITQDIMLVRPLGLTKSIMTQPASFIAATGNNLRVAGDLVRRSIQTRLDTKVEDPYLLTYESDPVAFILANRARCLAAVLTILQAFAVSGAERMPQLAGFGRWSDRVRSAIVWLGERDPVDCIATMKRDDTTRQPILALIEAWEAVIGLNVPVQASDLIAEAQRQPRRDYFNDDDLDPDDADRRLCLRDAIAAIATGKGGHLDAARLGMKLAAHKDAIFGNRRIERDATVTDGSARWRLTAIPQQGG